MHSASPWVTSSESPQPAAAPSDRPDPAARLGEEALAEQEVAVAAQHMDGSAGWLQRLRAARLEGQGEHVVAHPVFEEVAQDEQRVGLHGLQQARRPPWCGAGPRSGAGRR
jgi:hypothetical protein